MWKNITAAVCLSSILAACAPSLQYQRGNGNEITTVKDFKMVNSSSDTITKTELIHYINGIGVGMLAYNTYLDTFNKGKVFCFPEKDFDVDFYKIMETSVMDAKHKDSDPIPPILFYEIAHRFPCK